MEKRTRALIRKMPEMMKWTLVLVTYMIAVIRPRYGIGLVVFFLPFASRHISFGEIQVCLLVFMVTALFGGLLTRALGPRSGTNRRRPRLVNGGVIILFLVSITISFVGYIHNGLPANVAILNDEASNLIDYIAVLSSAMVLYAILVKSIVSGRDWLFYLRVFLSEILFLSVMYLLSGPVHLNLPDFLQPMTVVGTSVGVFGVTDYLYSQARFAGYIGYYENFVEYLVIEIALAAVLIAQRKNMRDLGLALIVIIASLLFGLLSGTRAFPILLIGLVVLVLVFQLRGGINRGSIYAGVLAIGGLGVIYFGLTYFSGSLLVTRLSSMDLHKVADIWAFVAADPGNNFFALINRADMLLYFDEIVKTAGLIGVGPLTVHTLSGTDMVFHSNYYGIYVSLGLLGVISYLLLNVNMMNSLREAFKNEKSEFLYAICASLTITLLLDGIKVSFWRIPPTVYIYWFLFGMIASLAELWKTGNWKPQTLPDDAR